MSIAAQRILAFTAAAAIVAVATLHGHAQQSSAPAAKFSPVTVAANEFLRDGKPYEILSGEIHYARVPREYWRDRLRKIRAMGLNTIQVYSFWNAHEPTPGNFDFSGNLDVAEFLRTAQQENLNVLMRLGPYVCAEWDAGGFPAWLFQSQREIKVRTSDPKFLEAAGKYIDRMGVEIAPFLASKGGPVIGFQIENEYGSYGPRAAHGMGADPEATRREAHEYMQAIRQLFVHAGLGDELLYTADGTDPEQMAMGALPGVLEAANFGPGEAHASIAKLKAVRPNQPVMVGEYWDGWFDAWGEDHQVTDAAQQLAEVKWFLDDKYSFNLYMVHGGTTPGYMNGANFDSGPDGHYAPETTSYDYDAPIDEAGRPTKKYFAFRDAITAHTGVMPPDVPQNLPIVAIPQFTLAENAPLSKNLGDALTVKNPISMEEAEQIPPYGYILYRTPIHANGPHSLKAAPPDESGVDASNGGGREGGAAGNSRLGSNDPTGGQGSDVPSSASGDGVHIGADGALIPQKRGAWVKDQITIKELHDYAAIYVNGKFMGSIDRRLKQDTLDFDLPDDASTLDILVENTGRVNFGRHLPDGQSGITKAVILDGAALQNWKMYLLPMATPAQIRQKARVVTPLPENGSANIFGWSKHKPEGPSFYRGHFTIDSPADTFLDVSQIQKGVVWVNGHNAGRVWDIGPVRSIYIPAPWLVRGENEVVVFDIFPSAAAETPSARDAKSVAIPPKTLRGVTDPIYIKTTPATTE